MKRVLTATGLAAMFAVGLAAQSTTGTSGTTAQDPQTTTAGQGRGGGPRTVTGCLRAGDTAGTYMLTNVEGMMGGRRGGDTTGGSTAAATTTGGGTTAGATTSGTSGQPGRGMGGPMNLMLMADSSVDLKAHVGHKIEVTGTVAGGGRRGGDTTGNGAATTGGSTTAGGTTTGTASTAGGTTTAAAGQTGGARGGTRSMNVTALKMVSDSCS